jgi:hypothetical protein
MSTVGLVRAVTFLFIIIVGGLAITNLGIICIACGDLVNKAAAIVGIVLGLVGLYNEFKAGAVKA